MFKHSIDDSSIGARPKLHKKVFTSFDAVEASERWHDHGGEGPILFRRIFEESDFKSAIDFIDYTVIPPASTIGRHEHNGNEEVYFVVSGSPLMRVKGETLRLHAGSFSVVRSGEWHELVNDTCANVEILVVQVHLA
jgi:mannose-6-phosphate isomerase-like protein (cupin superfamily)